MDENIRKFAEIMQYKIDKNKHKDCPIMNPDGTGRFWEDCTNDWLITRILDEVIELHTAILMNESSEDIAKECADIANFAMMIADNNNGLK